MDPASDNTTCELPHSQNEKMAFNNALGPGFARGWSKLPDELKVKILGCNLGLKGWVHRKVVQDALAPYLRMTPEIAGLACEVFYRSNAIYLLTSPVHPKRGVDYSCFWSSSYNRRLSRQSDPPSVPAFAYPPPTLNRWIRRLKVWLGFGRPYWPFLVRLASGAYGFQQLQYVMVWVRIDIGMLTPPERSNIIRDFEQSEVAEFKCDGELEVQVWSGRVDLAPEDSERAKAAVETKVVFNVGGNRVEGAL